MRDPKHIKEFCNQLALIWEKVPDWRFGQLISNVFGQISEEKQRDVFFIEDDEMIELIKKFFCNNGRGRQQ